MATLQYDISVIGANKLDAALAGIERRVGQHNRRVTGSPSPAAARRGVGASAESAHQKRLATIQAGHERRLSQQVLREKLRNENRLHRQKLQNIEREKEREIAAQRRANAAVARSRANTRGVVGGAAVRSVGGIGRGAVMAAGIGGTAIIASGVQKQVNIERQTAALANKAFGTPGETRSRQGIQASLIAQTTDVGRRTGNREEAVEALNKFVGISGSLKGGQKFLDRMAEFSLATGASMSDIGSTSGIILQNMAASRGIDLGDDAQLEAALTEVEQIMGNMAGQAKIGSIEFEQLATQMAAVMSATGRFEGDVSDLAAQMGAMGQLAVAGGAKSPDEAMTAILRFSDDLMRNAPRFEKMAKAAGLDASDYFVRNDEGKRVALKDPTGVMMDVLRATGGDIADAQKIFGIRSKKAFEPFEKAFNVERSRGATTEEALQSVSDRMQRWKDASMGTAERKASARFTEQQQGHQLKAAWEDLTMTAGQELVPVIREMVPELKKLMDAVKEGLPYLSGFMKTLAENPFSTIGKVIAAKVALDIGQAAIGNAVSQAITGQVASSGVASSLTGVGAAAGNARVGLAAMGGPLVALAAALGVAVVAINDATRHLDRGQDESVRRGAEGTNVVAEASARLRSGKSLTAEQRTALHAQLGSINKSESDLRRAAGQSILQTAGATLGVSQGIGLIEGQGITGPSDVDLRNRGEIETILKLDSAAQKSTDAAANQQRAAIELVAAAEAFKRAASTVPRSDKPSGGSWWW